MKTLYIIRHAKSDWSHLGQDDFERTLNTRGKANADEMAQRLKKRGITPDFIVSSSAKRAKKTAMKFAEILNFPDNKINFDSNLYLANIERLYDTVFGLDDKYQEVFLFGHNPGLTDFANDLAGAEIENIPTCGIVKIQFSEDRWNDITPFSGKVMFFDYPKKLSKD